ncbi:MAG: nuclear transport factor 2 family protein [Flavobacteriaceae bacterium]|nr:nuclear transport factor 2 family protein [Flavobacteriaceae bacterium]
MAWFDELLDTWMGICRGSGVLEKTAKGWKIRHYVLSVTVPNEDTQKVVSAKKEREELFLKSLK